MPMFGLLTHRHAKSMTIIKRMPFLRDLTAIPKPILVPVNRYKGREKYTAVKLKPVDEQETLSPIQS